MELTSLPTWLQNPCERLSTSKGTLWSTVGWCDRALNGFGYPGDVTRRSSNGHVVWECAIVRDKCDEKFSWTQTRCVKVAETWFVQTVETRL